jgi:hypothetical protein
MRMRVALMWRGPFEGERHLRMPDNDELRISTSRLAPTWSQTEIITDVPTSLETFLVPNSQDICQCCDVAA